MRFGAFLRELWSGPKPDPAAARQVKTWARGILLADAGTAISVNEIACLDPGCPGAETVILVMAPGRRTQAYKIPKLLDDVTEQDVGLALGVGEDGRGCPPPSEPSRSP